MASPSGPLPLSAFLDAPSTKADASIDPIDIDDGTATVAAAAPLVPASCLLTPDFLGRGLLRLEEHRNAIEAGKPVEIAVPLVYKPMMGKEKEAGQVFFTITWESRGGS